jgi:hypothetical protein
MRLEVMMMNINITVFCDMTPRCTVPASHFLGLLLNPEDMHRTFIKKNNELLLDYMASHPNRYNPSQSLS